MVRRTLWPSGKAPSSTAAVLGSVPAFAVDFLSRWSHTSDLRIGTPVVTLPGNWRYGVSAESGQPGVSIL